MVPAKNAKSSFLTRVGPMAAAIYLRSMTADRRFFGSS